MDKTTKEAIKKIETMLVLHVLENCTHGDYSLVRATKGNVYWIVKKTKWFGLRAASVTSYSETKGVFRLRSDCCGYGCPKSFWPHSIDSGLWERGELSFLFDEAEQAIKAFVRFLDDGDFLSDFIDGGLVSAYCWTKKASGRMDVK
jgi:hypothetical protein